MPEFRDDYPLQLPQLNPPQWAKSDTEGPLRDSLAEVRANARDVSALVFDFSREQITDADGKVWIVAARQLMESPVVAAGSFPWNLTITIENDQPSAVLSPGIIRYGDAVNSLVTINDVAESFVPAAGKYLYLHLTASALLDAEPACDLLCNTTWDSFPDFFEFDVDDNFEAVNYPLWAFVNADPGLNGSVEITAGELWGMRLAPWSHLATAQGWTETDGKVLPAVTLVPSVGGIA